jgi:hypothetical protein
MNLILHQPADNAKVTYRPPRMLVEVARAVRSSDHVPRWVDPRPAPLWEPIELHWHPGPTPAKLLLRRQLGKGPGQSRSWRPEEATLGDADRIVLRQAQGRGEWFRGIVTRQEASVSAGPEGESLIAEAMGCQALLSAHVVQGAWHLTPQATRMEILGSLGAGDRTSEKVFASQMPAVFNRNGLPNATPYTWQIHPNASQEASRAFVAESRPQIGQAPKAVHWTAYSALRSLVEWVDGYRIVSEDTDWEQIEATLGDQILPEISVDSLPLPQAIQAVLEPLGFGFAVEPWACEGRHRLLVFDRAGTLPGLAPRLGPGGLKMTDPEAVLVQAQQLRLRRDITAVCNDVKVLGDQKRIQIRFEFNSDPNSRSLHPAWRYDKPYLAAFQDPTTGKVSPRTWDQDDVQSFLDEFNRDGHDHGQYPDALRSFTWNEDYAYEDLAMVSPPQPGALSEHLVDAEGNWVVRPRRPGPTFRYSHVENDSALQPAQVVLGIEGCPEASVRVPALLWPDRCGVTLAIDSFFRTGTAGVYGEFKPFASLAASPLMVDGVNRTQEIRQATYLELLCNSINQNPGLRLSLQLDCSVETDTPVQGHKAWSGQGPWPMPRARQIRLPHLFTQRALAFDPGDVTYSLIDETPAATNQAAGIARQSQRGTTSGEILLRYLTKGWLIGDRVAGTVGRAIDLTEETDFGRFAPCVLGVRWTFGQANKTLLVLDSPRRQP